MTALFFTLEVLMGSTRQFRATLQRHDTTAMDLGDATLRSVWHRSDRGLQ